MAIPSTNPLVPSVIYTPTDALSTSAHAKVKKVSINEPIPSSFYTITFIHPTNPEALNHLSKDSGAIFNKEQTPPSLEEAVSKTQSIFNCIFCCCRR